MPVTLKQVEAFYWTATLGGFVEAAQRLNLAQSTVSKRILELEDVIGGPLFERTSRSLRLTRAGGASLTLGSELLALELRFREAAGGGAGFSGPFRFGVTELVALTWLPAFILAMKSTHPDLVPVPEVAPSVELFAKLVSNDLDLVVALDPPASPDLTAVPLQSVVLEWVSAPGFGPAEDLIPLIDLAQYPVLTQAEGSGLQRLVLDWAAANGMQANQIVQCNSLNVLAGLAAAGLGVTVLTANYFEPEIRAGVLRVIRTEPAIPPIRYFAVYRTQDLSPLGGRMATIASQCCDFSARTLPGRGAGP
ncbi:LysR family transcriptional regulator [Phreatobacter aquaticus]|uniref:LysR family transcriptional regulator n=1 Tax=Phreatobacter aquaticus TaxID=2570229 RepID=A0A4D7QFI6_9HYPH|nr:LysR family transcriptional regulator [Phreatobacter aquaticus]QCK84433.1 LysR family transcriptional regulator [Phreatobacter aquaticus]